MKPPLSRPYFCTASNTYSEQVGQYLQDGGSKGDINLRYVLIAPVTTLLGCTLITTVVTILTVLA